MYPMQYRHQPRCNCFPVKLLVSIIPVFFIVCSLTNPTENEPVLNPADWEITAQNSRLGKGINLGNALDAPTEGAWGVVLEEKYFSHVKALGFQSVRIPVRWSAHCDAASPYTIDETFFNRVVWAVDQAISNDLCVIINIHHFDSLTNTPEANKEMFLALWRQIADRFHRYGPELYFELCNEPRDNLTPALWNTYAAEALAVVRENNPYRSVLIGPGYWNSIDGLPELVFPADSFLILTMHYYKPDVFTHQGAAWVEGSGSWLGTRWRAQQSDTSLVTTHFNRIDAWAAANNVPVFLGEFGAFDSADALSRTLYTSFIAKQATARNWSYAYWKYNFDFGIYDDSTDVTRFFLVNALLNPVPVFDSCLQLVVLDTETVDPGSAQFIVLDDFEDTLYLHNRLVNRYMEKYGTIADSSFCWWSIWHSDSSSVCSDQGVRILPWEELDTTNQEPNLHLLYSSTGEENTVLYLKGYVKGSSYPYVGIGTTCPGEYGVEWFDFSSLTSIVFCAKGYGYLRVNVVTDTVLNGYSQEDNWGDFGCDFTLTPEWQQFIIPVADLKPKMYSEAESDGLVWDDGMKKVCYINFCTNHKYGKTIDDSLELYLDDIRLYGMTEESFGLGK